MTAVEHHKFETLDAIRGVAAVAVVIFHFGKLLPRDYPVFAFSSGYLAVDLFFALSGFVIAFAYDQKLEGGMRFLDFLARRLIRVLPMIWLGVAIGTAYLIVVSPRHWLAAIASGAANLVILPNLFFIRWGFFPANGVEWSLFYEIVANLLYGAAFRILRAPLLTGIILVASVSLIGCALHYGSLHVGPGRSQSVAALSRVGFSFFVGVALCRSRHHWERRVPRLRTPLVLLIVAGTLYMPVTSAHRYYDILFVFLMSPLLVMLGSVAEARRADGRAAVFLAALSYPIYAIHHPIRNITGIVCSRFGVSSAALGGCVVTLLIIVSINLAKRYDAPLRAGLSQLLQRKYRTGNR